KERSASAVRKRIGPALAIVDDESFDGHGLHCGRSDANSSMADAGCGAEQDHALLCGERGRRLCHSYSRRRLLAFMREVVQGRIEEDEVRRDGRACGAVRSWAPLPRKIVVPLR